MKKSVLFLIIMSVFIISSCAFKQAGAENLQSYTEGENKVEQLNIKINGQNFTAELYDNQAGSKLKTFLPLQLNMKELNGNEKYCYLDSSLPAQAQKVGKINAGDIMLFGNDCLVVFYKSFNTSYSYTRLGRITNAAALEKAVGRGSVQMNFSLMGAE